jgi:uncharacterized protein YutE (UPF0331/DUF86 family)
VSPSRIRSAVVADKIQAVERMLAGVRSLPLASEAELLADPRMVAAGESFLRRGLEALFDLGRHVLAKGFGEPVAEYEAIAQRLGERSVLDAAQVERLRAMAGYRNRLVHFYDEVTPAELYRILTEHVDDVRRLLDALRSWIAAHPELIDESP